MSKPINHFSKFIHDFIDRTQCNKQQIAECSNLPIGYVRLYARRGTQPNIQQFIKLAIGMSIICKCSKYRMMHRLLEALEKDIKGEKYPPKERAFEA